MKDRYERYFYLTWQITCAEEFLLKGKPRVLPDLVTPRVGFPYPHLYGMKESYIHFILFLKDNSCYLRNEQINPHFCVIYFKGEVL